MQEDKLNEELEAGLTGLEENAWFGNLFSAFFNSIFMTMFFSIGYLMAFLDNPKWFYDFVVDWEMFSPYVLQTKSYAKVF